MVGHDVPHGLVGLPASKSKSLVGAFNFLGRELDSPASLNMPLNLKFLRDILGGYWYLGPCT